MKILLYYRHYYKTMLKTNSKQARENIRAYIVDNFDGTNYAPDFDYIEQAQQDNTAGIIGKHCLRIMGPECPACRKPIEAF